MRIVLGNCPYSTITYLTLSLDCAQTIMWPKEQTIDVRTGSHSLWVRFHSNNTRRGREEMPTDTL